MAIADDILTAYYGGTNAPTNDYLKQPSVDYNDPNLPSNIRLAFNQDKAPQTFVGSIFDVLSRGNYFSATIADSVLSKGLRSLPEAVINATGEFVDPQARLSYRDILSRYAPQFSQEHPYGADIVGLGLDVALDPTSYLGFGAAGRGKTIGGAVLNEAGHAVLSKVVQDEGLKIAQEIGQDGADRFIRKSISTLFRSNDTVFAQQYGESVLGKILKDSDYAATKLKQLGFDSLIGEKLTQEKGFRIFYGVGSHELELPVYKVLNPIFDGLGITAATDKLVNVAKEAKILGFSPYEAIKGVKDTFKSAFVKDGDLAPEIADSFRFIENKAGNLKENVVQDLFSIADMTKSKDFNLERVTKALQEIDLTTSNIAESRGLTATQNASQVANSLATKGFVTNDERLGIAKTIFDKSGLTTDEQSVVNLLQQKHNELQFINNATDILTEQVRNFDKEGYSLVKGDDYLRYKQALLDGNLQGFVASNPDLQSKIYSLDVAKDFFNKKQFINDGEKLTYGRAIQNLTNDELSKQLNVGGISENFKNIFSGAATDNITGKTIDTSKSAVLEGLGDQRDLNKFASILVNDGFKFSESIPGQKALGDIVDNSNKTYQQLVFKHNDGSLIRVLRESNPGENLKRALGNGKFDFQPAEKFTIIKSVVSPNEEFAKGILGNNDIQALSLDAIKNAPKIGEQAILDPLGNAVTSIYKGGVFDAVKKDLESKGVDVELNALTLYAQRAFTAQKESSESLFKTGLQLAYGVDKVSDLPKEVTKKLKYLGEGLYASGMDEASKNALMYYDKALGTFKFGATALRPMFAPRQVIQNPVQMFIAGGKGAFNFFDPRVILEAGASIIDHVVGGNKLGEFVVQNAYKNPADRNFFSQALEVIRNQSNLDKLAETTLVNPMGQKRTLKDLVLSFQDNGVLKGGLSDNLVKRNLLDEVKQYTNNDKGILSLLKSTLNYTKYPEIVENFFRTAYGINGFRNGLFDKDSAKLVDKALFNYQTSLTTFETRVLKRLVPFYTFQRNAIPLIFNSIFERPGVVSSVGKGQSTFLDIWNKLNGGDILTPEERKITPDFIWEQTGKFKGRDKDGNLSFSSFNSFTPFDAINLLQYDKFGDLDAQATFKKTLLANISPFIKMPIEAAYQRLFFSDRLIKESNKLGGIGRVFDNFPQPVKDLLQAETYIDPRTNKPTTYINPWLAYSINNLPFLNEIVRPLDPDKTKLEAFESLITGIQTYKYNKQQLEIADSLNYKRQVNDLKSQYSLAIHQGRPKEAERRLQELRKFLTLKQQENQYQNPPVQTLSPQ